jgi:hypothetical protein
MASLMIQEAYKHNATAHTTPAIITRTNIITFSFLYGWEGLALHTCTL